MRAKIPDISVIRSSRNPWLFSKCSVEDIKDLIEDRKCLRIPGSPYDINEYRHTVSKKPGAVYNATEQCRLIIGRYSIMCDVCILFVILSV
ncbi:hypothetical protein CHS0354_032413 [Potamilus streckersoni]|uniref:Uncharacterized protein n=1 Tax=Potamilus streckersoni TaxID=2493646 RepID=A0AAE0S2R4_9BIVA|nr:hypothetical protein CHS0354_032413 [Potamilus streckersoni]